MGTLPNGFFIYKWGFTKHLRTGMILQVYVYSPGNDQISHQTGSSENHQLQKLPAGRGYGTVPWSVSISTHDGSYTYIHILTQTHQKNVPPMNIKVGTTIKGTM